MKHEVEIETKSFKISELKNTDHVGFKSDVRKWEVVCVDKLYNAITNDEFIGNCNWQMHSGAGSLKECVTHSLQIVKVTELYKFDTRKELYQWLSED